MTEETTKKIKELSDSIENADIESKIMKQHTYFGMLLSTSAQIMHSGDTYKRTVKRAVTLIDLCAKTAGITLKEIKP